MNFELRNFLAPVCFSALLLSCDHSQSCFIVVLCFRDLCYRRPWSLAIHHHVGGVLRAGLYIQLYQVLSLPNLPLDTILTPCILPHKDTSAVYCGIYHHIKAYSTSFTKKVVWDWLKTGSARYETWREEICKLWSLTTYNRNQLTRQDPLMALKTEKM